MQHILKIKILVYINIIYKIDNIYTYKLKLENKY